MRTYYHFTTKEKLESIQKDMELKAIFGNYVCSSLEDIQKFLAISPFPDEDVRIIEFKTKSKFEESFDHNAKFFKGARAYVCWHNVKIRKIVKVYGIAQE